MNEHNATVDKPQAVKSMAVSHDDHLGGNGDYVQAGHLYRQMTAEQQGRWVSDVVNRLGKVHSDEQMRQLCYFFRADIDYGRQIASGLGIHIDMSMLQGL